MQKSTILLCFILIMGIVMLTGCTSRTQYQPANTEAAPVSAPESTGGNLKILEHHLERGDYGIINVVGTAQNVGSSRISYGQIEVKFYDKDGVMIGNGLANFNNLDPGEKWGFKAMYLGQDSAKIATYKIGVGASW